MTKMKFVFAVIAVLIGAGGAYATRVQETDKVNHNWVDANNVFIFTGTVAQAENNCPGEDVFCLRASDSPSLIVKTAN